MSIKHSHIILYDGLCNLCNSSVQFVIKRDPKSVFSFAALQSEIALSLLKKQNIDDIDSIIYIKEDVIYTKSTAALYICKNLKGLWPILYVFIMIPGPIRDGIYNWVAKNRYKWFGKRKECMIPDEEIKSRFLS